MKKSIPFLLTFVAVISAQAQSYSGFYHDNYAGVQSVLYNPASIVDSRFKTDINLFSFSTAVSNDAYGVKVMDAIKDGYDFDTQAKKTITKDNNGRFNLDIMGPAFMFNLAPKHSIAIFTRARTFLNFVGINGKLIEENINETTLPYNENFGSSSAVGNSWGELGLSYAAVLYQQGQHFIKGGITAKYLQGVANYHAQATNVNLAFAPNPLNPRLSTYTTTGTATYGSSQDFENDDFELDTNSKGYGLDLGFVYEWRPEYTADRNDLADLKYLNKYKVKVGLALTDLGSIKYSKGIREVYDLNSTLTENDVDESEDFDELIKNNYTPISNKGSYSAKLPTALHADVDWNIHNKFYLNANLDLSMVKEDDLNQSSIANRFSLTPRYESRWFSCYVPVSHLPYNKQTQVGFGLRTGFLFIGSGSAVSNLVSKNSMGADVHLGLKIPVYQKKKKDADADGILDKNDKCPTEAGPEENKGCPWPDTDADGTLDKNDKCANQAGPAENKGCPWGDEDKDSVTDNVDKCPTVAGVAENGGCPWPDTDGDTVLDKDDKCPTQIGLVANAGCPERDTDGDNVLDKDDKCPTVAGIVANFGCPEVKAVVEAPSKEIMKTINEYSKTILFDSGKTTIKAESLSNVDAIVVVLNEYPTSKFKLDGHTDSAGNPASNLKLSKGRAEAVKNYLISKGISPERLSSQGFGSKKPIASNKTTKGKNLNRRVEILLVK